MILASFNPASHASAYALFLLRTAERWQLIVNRGTGAWGTDSPRPTSGYAELRGRLRIVWGATELSTVWHIVP
jgi:hypothetical protein